MIRILLTSLLAITLNASKLEKDYVNKYCNGQKEYKVNNARIDCLTDFVAYEFDYANKWYEAIGQSLYYGILTQRESGIYLIVRDDKDYKYVGRAKLVCDAYEIRLIVIDERKK